MSDYTNFKDLSAGVQSVAIVIATFLAGLWAVFQFFSLRPVQKARRDLEKADLDNEWAKRELRQNAVIVTELFTESFDIGGSYFLHVRVVMKNIGLTFEVADWRQMSISATRFEKVDEATLKASDQVLRAWGPSSIEQERLLPGYFTGNSFLIPIPQPGVYYVIFSMLVSPTARAGSLEAFGEVASAVSAESQVIWMANRFVSVPQAQPDAGLFTDIRSLGPVIHK